MIFLGGRLMVEIGDDRNVCWGKTLSGDGGGGEIT